MLLQLLGHEVTLRRIGRLAQGAVVLAWAMASLDAPWSAGRVALLAAAIASGTTLWLGLLVLQATLSFWTVETLEIMNTVTYGGVETAQYPLTIYRPWFRRFFTFVVPLACINYFPSLAILGRPGRHAILNWAAPTVGVAFLFVTLQVWKLGVRHYCSTGS